MTDTAQTLRDLKPQHGFLIGFDSDGCAFDTMELKHKECFCPQVVKHFCLQAVAKYAREVWDFVNLYSTTRGTNRFPALITALDLLADRSEVTARHVAVPRLEGLRRWVKAETKLGGPALRRAAEASRDADLLRVLAWNDAVNAAIEDMVHGVAPFPLVRESLQKAAPHSDLMVVSQTPGDALEREWGEHGLTGLLRVIAGQECGTKEEHLRFAAGGKYPSAHVLMVGDALGDLAAARGAQTLFFPIIPGAEEASWLRFHDEALARFFAGTYAGTYQDGLIRELEKALPATAPW
jgi:phosphoglycolate phosphatase-like HAD superfamily hydrolase